MRFQKIRQSRLQTMRTRISSIVPAATRPRSLLEYKDKKSMRGGRAGAMLPLMTGVIRSVSRGIQSVKYSPRNQQMREATLGMILRGRQDMFGAIKQFATKAGNRAARAAREIRLR